MLSALGRPDTPPATPFPAASDSWPSLLARATFTLPDAHETVEPGSLCELYWNSPETLVGATVSTAQPFLSHISRTLSLIMSSVLNLTNSARFL